MIDVLQHEVDDLSVKLDEINARLLDNAQFANIASNEVVRTVALSNEIASEVKEVLLVLQTTMATEFTEAKTCSFKDNNDILNIVADAIRVQSKVINRLVSMEKRTQKPKWNILVEYKKPISVVLVVTVLWTLAVMNAGAMDHIMTGILAAIKGI